MNESTPQAIPARGHSQKPANGLDSMAGEDTESRRERLVVRVIQAYPDRHRADSAPGWP
jgi:hypothetical protein